MDDAEGRKDSYTYTKYHLAINFLFSFVFIELLQLWHCTLTLFSIDDLTKSMSIAILPGYASYMVISSFLRWSPKAKKEYDDGKAPIQLTLFLFDFLLLGAYYALAREIREDGTFLYKNSLAIWLSFFVYILYYGWQTAYDAKINEKNKHSPVRYVLPIAICFGLGLFSWHHSMLPDSANDMCATAYGLFLIATLWGFRYFKKSPAIHVTNGSTGNLTTPISDG